MRYDPNPTVNGRDPEAYAKYAERLDREVPGWHNDDLGDMTPALRQQAEVRRVEERVRRIGYEVYEPGGRGYARRVQGGIVTEAARIAYRAGQAAAGTLTRLSSEVGPSGFDISDEMLGGLALANAVLRARLGDPAYLAGREAEGRRIADRLRAEAAAATNERDRSLLNETALIARDLDAYAKAYPIGLGRPGNDVTE